MNNSLDNIMVSGWYVGNNISQLSNTSIGSQWVRIYANVQSDKSASFISVTTTWDSMQAYLITRNNNMQYSDAIQLALKSDLADFIKLVQIQTESSITLEANADGTVDIPFTVPTGYKYIGTIDAWTNNPNVTTSNHYRTNEGNIRVDIKNLSSQKISSYVYAYAFCIHV